MTNYTCEGAATVISPYFVFNNELTFQCILFIRQGSMLLYWYLVVEVL